MVGAEGEGLAEGDRGGGELSLENDAGVAGESGVGEGGEAGDGEVGALAVGGLKAEEWAVDRPGEAGDGVAIGGPAPGIGVTLEDYLKAGFAAEHVAIASVLWGGYEAEKA
jgi:hypothetical protein